MPDVSMGDVLDGSDRREIRPRSPRPGPATLRRDAWWLQPTATAGMLFLFVVYSTWAAFQNGNYYSAPYISPFYSPCIASSCGEHANLAIFGSWWRLSPALLVLIFPLGFRLTCYYYRKAYYRSFWLSPPACAVAEPHAKYSGETKLPLIGNNIHRYFFYAGLVFNTILTYDAIIAFAFEKDGSKHFGVGLGTIVLLANATMLWLYSLSCHSCRHIMGGRLNHFSKHPLRYKFWTVVSKLNHSHMKFAWVSLIGVALTDAYVWAVSSGLFNDPRWIS